MNYTCLCAYQVSTYNEDTCSKSIRTSLGMAIRLGHVIRLQACSIEPFLTPLLIVLVLVADLFLCNVAMLIVVFGDSPHVLSVLSCANEVSKPVQQSMA